MDANLQGASQDSPESVRHDDGNGGFVGVQPDLLAACTLCGKHFLPANESTIASEAICGDCNFLLLEDYGNPLHESPPRAFRGRRNRQSSSESIDYHLSQQLLQVIDTARQNDSTFFGREGQLVDREWLPLHSSSHTTPSGSRRWRRGLSDTESDILDNFNSLYGESESNISFSRYRAFHGESDTVSFSAYGGDSDVSLDGRSFLNISHLDGDSNFDSDTDIDPMHAGSYLWNFGQPDGEAEGEDEEEGRWEEAGIEEGIEETTVDSTGMVAPLAQPLTLEESIDRVIRDRQFHPSESDGFIRWRIREGRHTYTSNLFAGMDRPGLSRDVGNFGDYLDGRRFEELLEHLAEMDSSRRGGPPTAMSFINNMPRIIVLEEHVKQDGLACAICKDIFSVGSEVSQLPCFHFYHPSCISPWLRARNSCPLCRYELPTDDKDYEEGKRSIGHEMVVHDIRPQGASEDSYSYVSDGGEVDEDLELSQDRMEAQELVDVNPAETGTSQYNDQRGRWFIYAAAPIVSLVGFVLVLWFSNPLIEGRGRIGHCNFYRQGLHHAHASGSSARRRENSSRRWWSLF